MCVCVCVGARALVYICIYVCMCVSVNTLNYAGGYPGEITGKNLHTSNSINDICSERKVLTPNIIIQHAKTRLIFSCKYVLYS